MHLNQTGGDLQDLTEWEMVSSIENFKNNFGFNQRVKPDALLALKEIHAKKNVSFASGNELNLSKKVSF